MVRPTVIFALVYTQTTLVSCKLTSRRKIEIVGTSSCHMHFIFYIPSKTDLEFQFHESAQGRFIVTRQIYIYTVPLECGKENAYHNNDKIPSFQHMQMSCERPEPSSP